MGREDRQPQGSDVRVSAGNILYACPSSDLSPGPGPGPSSSPPACSGSGIAGSYPSSSSQEPSCQNILWHTRQRESQLDWPCYPWIALQPAKWDGDGFECELGSESESNAAAGPAVIGTSEPHARVNLRRSNASMRFDEGAEMPIDSPNPGPWCAG